MKLGYPIWFTDKCIPKHANPYLLKMKFIENLTLPCADCKNVYITGESGRSDDQRLREHRCAIRRGDVNNALFIYAHIIN